MSIATRLKRGFLITALMTSIIGVFCAWYAHNISVEFRVLSREVLPTVQALETLRFAGLRVVSSTSEFVFLKNEQGADREPEETLSWEKRLVASGQCLFRSAFTDYLALCSSHSHEKSMQMEIKAAFEQLDQTSNEIIAKKNGGISGKEVLALKERFEAEEMAFLNLVDTAIGHKYQEMATGREKVLTSAGNAFKGIILVSLALFFFTFFYGRWLSDSITLPITELCRASNELGLGRLHIRIPNWLTTKCTPRDMSEIDLLVGNFNRMAEELERSMVDRDLIDLILNRFDDGLIITNPEGMITFANLAAGALLGCARSDLAGQPAANFFQYLTLVTHREQNATEQEGAGNFVMLPAVFTCKGREFEILTTALSPVQDDRQRVGHLFSFREKRP